MTDFQSSIVFKNIRYKEKFFMESELENIF